MKGAISKKGYLKDSPDRKNDFNLVPSNRITMKGVDQPLKLIPIKFPQGYTGEAVNAKPGQEYKFPGYNMVLELPTNLMQQGGSPYSQESQVPVMPYYNTGPLQQFQSIMNQGGSPYPVMSQLPVMNGYNASARDVYTFFAQGGSPYSVPSQLPVMNGYNASPQGAYTFFKQGGEEPCIPCILEHVSSMRKMQDGGSTGKILYPGSGSAQDGFSGNPNMWFDESGHGWQIQDPNGYNYKLPPTRLPEVRKPIPVQEKPVPRKPAAMAPAPAQKPAEYKPAQKQAVVGNIGLYNADGTPIQAQGKPPIPAQYQYPGGAAIYYRSRGLDDKGNPLPKHQAGGTAAPAKPQYTFDQYYKDLNAWQNPSAQSVPTNIANYESTWIVPTIKTYQTTLNAALAKKYKLQAGQAPAQNQFLSATEAQGALGGQDKYADYLNYVQGYQAYRSRTSGTYSAPSQTSGNMDPNGEAYGYRHFGLFTLNQQQQQANQSAAAPALQKAGVPVPASPAPTMQMGGSSDNDGDVDEFDEGGNWIGKASDKMEKKGTKGTFTSYCGGKVTEECIKRGLASSNPTTRKRAAFAKAMHHIAKKKSGGDVPSQYEGLGYREKHNAEFVNTIAQNFGMHTANAEIDNMEELHRKMFGGQTHFQTGGANLPMGNVYSTTTTDPSGAELDLPLNPTWNMPDPGVVNPNQVQTIEMDPNQLQGRPVTSAMQPEQHKNWYLSMTGQQAANGILAGTSAIAGVLERSQRRKQDQLLRQKQGADNSFLPVPASMGSRGDYDTNSGMLRPDKMVPTQFPGGAPTGYGYSSYKSGGEYYMSEDDIAQILAGGGEIEYID